MGANGYLPDQLSGPIADAYMSAVQSNAHNMDSGIAYIDTLSITTANTIGTGSQELQGLGYLVGYNTPTLSVIPANSFLLGDAALYPVATTTIGLGDGSTTGGRLSDANASPSTSGISNDIYRKCLTIVARIKRNGNLSVALIDQLASTFSTNYSIVMPGGVVSGMFVLGDAASYPFSTTTAGLGDGLGSGGLLSDQYAGLTGDILLRISDNIGATNAAVIQNIANSVMTNPQLSVVYLGT